MNAPPTAQAERVTEDAVGVGAVVEFSGSRSFAPAGERLSHQWRLVQQPPASRASVSRADTPRPFIVPDVPGAYVIELVVEAGGILSTPDTVPVSVDDVWMGPIAVIAVSEPAVVGMVLDASGADSVETDGFPLSYTWTLSAVPAGSAAALAFTDRVATSWVPDVAGAYTLELVVSNGFVSAPPTQVIVTVAEAEPEFVADAGDGSTVNVGDVVRLDGRGSLGPTGVGLAYQWRLVSMPAESLTVLNGDTQATPWFVADRAGEYVFMLTVGDGVVWSAPDTVSLIATGSGLEPIADAGPDQQVSEGDLVALDGSGSSPARGGALAYRWRFVRLPPGSLAELSDAALENPTFVADLPGDYELELLVTEVDRTSPPNRVVVTAAPIDNTAPTVPTFSTLSGETGQVVTLDASSVTDTDGDTLTFTWGWQVLPPGTNASLSSTGNAIAWFTPDVPGTYTVWLKVSDGREEVLTTITIEVVTANSPPVADAGPDAYVSPGSVVALDGSGSSDPDGTTLIWAWSLVTRPAGSSASLLGSNTSTPTFVPDQPGLYTVWLTVSDGTYDATDSVDFQAVTGNLAPVADAGLDETAAINDTVALDGSGSHDPNGDPLTFIWKLDSRPVGSVTSLVAPTSVRPSIFMDVEGTYVVSLVVSDGTVYSVADTVTLTCQRPNTAPKAVATAVPYAMARYSTVVLDGSASSDADGDFLSWAWEVLERPPGSTASLSDQYERKPWFKPDVPGRYVFRVVVSDWQLSTTSPEVTVIAEPPLAVEIVSGGTQSTPIETDFPAPFVVRVRTAHDIVAPGVPVRALYTYPELSVGNSYGRTVDSGEVEFSILARRLAGTFVVTASCTVCVQGQEVVGSFEVTPGPPTQGSLDPVEPATVGGSVGVTAIVMDRFGNSPPDMTDPLEVVLTVDGSATFGSTATTGTLVSGGGTQKVTARFSNLGTLEIPLTDAVGETVTVIARLVGDPFRLSGGTMTVPLGTEVIPTNPDSITWSLDLTQYPVTDGSGSLTLVANGDLNLYNETLDVRVNDAYARSMFRYAGPTCQTATEVWGYYSTMYRAVIAADTMTVKVTPTIYVGATECPGATVSGTFTFSASSREVTFQ